MVVDQYPYDRSSTNLGITLPSWALADGADAMRKRFTDPRRGPALCDEMQTKAHGARPSRLLLRHGGQLCSRSIDRTARPSPRSTALEGRPKTLRGEIETILDMMAKGGAQMVYHSMGDEDVERIMRYPNTAFASDGGDS